LISLEDIRAHQGGFRLVVDSLRLRKGDFVAVLGNNGSGKSTFLSVLSGLRSFSGKYIIGGEDFNKVSERRRHRIIGLLPQSTTLNMPFDAFYVVLTGRFVYTDGWRYDEEDLEKTEMRMRELDILHLRDRYFNELSGGEKQRVLLARTLNRESPVLLLDEPLSGIDLRHQHEFVRLLKGISGERVILMVIHDLSLALREFERFIFFIDGRLSYDARRDEIREERLSEIFGVKVSFFRHDKRVLVYTEGVNDAKTCI
jgi:iron complex transport system ATP-binding protein